MVEFEGGEFIIAMTGKTNNVLVEYEVKGNIVGFFGRGRKSSGCHLVLFTAIMEDFFQNDCWRAGASQPSRRNGPISRPSSVVRRVSAHARLHYIQLWQPRIVCLQRMPFRRRERERERRARETPEQREASDTS